LAASAEKNRKVFRIFSRSAFFGAAASSHFNAERSGNDLIRLVTASSIRDFISSREAVSACVFSLIVIMLVIYI
jgi:hypothetical protein